jgi:peptidoglycan/xylan/chitin deacetylase (PgdA/CDA1 family)
LKRIILILVILGICSCTFLDNSKIEKRNQLKNNEEALGKVIITLSPEIISPLVIVPTLPGELVTSTNPDNSKVRQGPGKVDIPILLYHHITNGAQTNSYSVSKDVFREQMDYLSRNGFKTISMDDLIRSIQFGTDLPIKPVMITFDDGNENVYLNAFPIMKEKEFTGIVLIIANRIGADGFLSGAQLRNLYRQGWEIGSHGMRHVDLVKEPLALRDEIANSKKLIEKTLDLEITIFAYPYGKANPLAMDWVKRIGYRSALGLGISNEHGSGNLYYLQRREVKNEFGLVEFAQLLEKAK